MSIITSDDLPAVVQASELVTLMVAGANAKAARVAPCLASEDPVATADQMAEAKLVLVGAVKRWAEAGAGAFESQSAGPFSVAVDTRQRTGFNLWPSEIEALQDICRSTDDTTSGAFSIDTAGCYGNHSEVCALYFGALYCSCGVDIAGFPLYEVF